MLPPQSVFYILPWVSETQVLLLPVPPLHSFLGPPLLQFLLPSCFLCTGPISEQPLRTPVDRAEMKSAPTPHIALVPAAEAWASVATPYLGLLLSYSDSNGPAVGIALGSGSWGSTQCHHLFPSSFHLDFNTATRTEDNSKEWMSDILL